MKDELINKLNSQVNVWKKDMESAKAEAENEQASEEVRKDKEDKRQALQAKIDDAKSKISEIREASGDKLDQIKKDVSSWFSSAS